MRANSKIAISYLALFIISHTNQALAEEKDISNSEPVIASCLRDKICSCREAGGNVYEEGFKIRCIFRGKNIEQTYHYFSGHHTSEIAGLLPKEPIKKIIKSKNKNKESEEIEISYSANRRTGKIEIKLDYTYCGYGYVFTPGNNSTILDFLYFSYN